MISGCLYGWLIKNIDLSESWGFLLIIQSFVSLYICVLGNNDWKNSRLDHHYQRYIYLGILYALSNIIPLWISASNLIDYGHGSLVRICSVIFSALWNYKQTKWSGIFLMIISLLLGKFATDGSNQWPDVSFGILLALLSGGCASLLGILQQDWNPYSSNALLMNLTALCFTSAIVPIQLSSTREEQLPFIGAAILAFAAQTWAINRFFASGAKADELGLVLSFRKILFVMISSNWASLNWTLYGLSIVFASWALRVN